MIVYTAIYGDYDNLRPHLDLPGVDWICFTDNHALLDNPRNWEVHYEPGRYNHPRLNAKWWRCHPPTVGTAIWTDGSIQWLDGGYLLDIEQLLDHHDVALLRHIDRDCIYEEAAVSMPLDKYLNQPIGTQIDFYRRQLSWPAHNGLWQTGILGWAGTQKARQIGAAWFAHNWIFTYQDQLSFPIIVDQYDAKVADLPGGFWENPAFIYQHHNRDD